MSQKTKKYIVLVGIIVVVLLTIGFLTRGKNSSASTSNTPSDIGGAKESAAINREFIFPIKDASGEQVSSLKYTIETAELRDEIIVKGQKATSIKGRIFLILTVKITNDLDKVIQINTRDYVRLIRNGNPGEQLAPDIHNDPVEIQPISTKYTRVGFPINDGDKDLQLQVGEIKGTKELIPVIFD